ncbi:MAG: hypothetical protein Q8P15_01690 [Nanoarchaeota archaeon]|nr:hypothetical protein [Nanoarchaeota archaeon]
MGETLEIQLLRKKVEILDYHLRQIHSSDYDLLSITEDVEKARVRLERVLKNNGIDVNVSHTSPELSEIGINLREYISLCEQLTDKLNDYDLWIRDSLGKRKKFIRNQKRIYEEQIDSLSQ